MLAYCRRPARVGVISSTAAPRSGGGPGASIARTIRHHDGRHLYSSVSPPYKAEDIEVAKQVKAAAPDVLWVGLSTPKQERWMYEHREKLKVPVILGVGAAFDMNSGRLKRAPAWMRESGLEWFYRLLSEPRRLWRRYLVIIPQSMWSISLELCHIRKFE